MMIVQGYPVPQPTKNNEEKPAEEEKKEKKTETLQHG